MKKEISAKTLEFVESALGISRAELLQAVNPPARRIDAWMSGKLSLPECTRIWEDLQEVSLQLTYTFQPGSVLFWLNQPSRYLKGEAPITFIRRGQPEKVIEAIRAMEESVYI